MKSVEEKVDRNNPLQMERLEHIKVQVIDHLQVTKERQNRSRTGSKRKGSDQDDEDSHSYRLRTASPQ